MDYVPKYFKSYELVSRAVYEEFKRNARLPQIWQLFDPRILDVGDRIRKRYGKMVANTWWWKGGKHQQRGFRAPGCKVGARWSQHRFGRAEDLVPTECAVEEIRLDIIRKGEDFHWITCVEEGVSWLHVDCRNYQGLLIVYP